MRLRLALLLVAAVAGVVAALGAGVRSSYGGQVAVDEPQYLLTAISLAEDRSLDVADELRERRWLDFSEATIPRQTAVQPGGREVSPHDPLLPLLLAGPVALGGWLGAKLALALVAAALAALLAWTAVRRLGVPLPLAAVGAIAAACSPPLAAYGSQVYPELPAALVVTVATAALLGPELSRRGTLVVAACVVALPWLSVKYALVASALAVVLLARLPRRPAAMTAGCLTVAGGTYLALHQIWYGGWTAYAAGDHFLGSGELGVVGFDPDPWARTARLLGLLVDRGFGLVAWQPAWLLLVPALAWVVVRRPRGWPVLVLPLAAGWATATWVAVTMHGYWWPGRQLVVVLPLGVLVVLRWLAAVPTPLRAGAAALALLGLIGQAWLLVDGWARRLTWVVGPERVGDPLGGAVRALLPDYRVSSGRDLALHALWLAAVLAVAALALRPRLPSRAAVAVAGLMAGAVLLAALGTDDGRAVRTERAAASFAPQTR